MQQEWRDSHCDVTVGIMESPAIGSNLVYC